MFKRTEGYEVVVFCHTSGTAVGTAKTHFPRMSRDTLLDPLYTFQLCRMRKYI